MNPQFILRLISGAALGLVLFFVMDRFDQKHLADAAKACAKAAASPDKPLTDCLPAVRDRLTAERQAQACNAALLPALRPETRFAMQQACSSGVKRLVADADALRADRDALAGRLAEQQSGELAAIKRAEGRATRLNQGDDHARKVIDAAPRDAAGGIHCDALCLQQLAH